MGYKKYTDEFKRDVLARVAEGKRSVAQIERDLELTPGLIYKWQQRYRVKDAALEASAVREIEARVVRDISGFEQRHPLARPLWTGVSLVG